MDEGPEPPIAETKAIETHGVREKVTVMITNVSADALTFGLFLLAVWIPLWTTVKFDYPFEAGVEMYGLMFTFSGGLVALGYIVLNSYRAVKTTSGMLTPPYDHPSITFMFPDGEGGEEIGYITTPSILWKSVFIAMTFLVGAGLMAFIIASGIQRVDDPLGLVVQIYADIPSWVSSPLLETISNFTNIPVATIVNQTRSPALVTVLILLYGPVCLFAVLSTWNFLYGLQLFFRQVYRGMAEVDADASSEEPGRGSR